MNLCLIQFPSYDQIKEITMSIRHDKQLHKTTW